MIYKIIGWLLYGVAGFSLAHGGIFVSDWEFWTTLIGFSIGSCFIDASRN